MYTLITGASKGIGHALANEFAKHGHDLVLTARNEQELNQLADLLRQQYSIKTLIFPMDLSLPDGVPHLLEELNKQNLQFDVLVNNAGLGYLGLYTEMTEHRLQSLLQVNMNAVSLLTHHFGRLFTQQSQGKILQVASIAAFQPGPYMAAYYASKAYVYSLSRALSYEFKRSGVSLSILCPGPTQTAFLHQAKMDDSHLAKGFLGMMSAEAVAVEAYKGLMKGKKVIIPGLLNKILALTTKLSPETLSMRITAYMHKK